MVPNTTQSPDARTTPPSPDRPLPTPPAPWSIPKPRPIPVVHWYV